MLWLYPIAAIKWLRFEPNFMFSGVLNLNQNFVANKGKI